MEITRLVLLDDDSDDLLLLQEAFAQTGVFEVTTFVDADACLQYLTSCPESALPQVIITDLNMPKKTGIDFIKLAKQSSRLANIYIAVCSTSNLQIDIDACKQTGASDYFVKPGTFNGYCLIAHKMKEQMLVKY